MITTLMTAIIGNARFRGQAGSGQTQDLSGSNAVMVGRVVVVVVVMMIVVSTHSCRQPMQESFYLFL